MRKCVAIWKNAGLASQEWIIGLLSSVVYHVIYECSFDGFQSSLILMFAAIEVGVIALMEEHTVFFKSFYIMSGSFKYGAQFSFFVINCIEWVFVCLLSWADTSCFITKISAWKIMYGRDMRDLVALYLSGQLFDVEPCCLQFWNTETYKYFSNDLSKKLNWIFSFNHYWNLVI
jgi:hypothetical protein